MKFIIYSLRTINDKSELSIDLTGKAIDNTYNIHVNLESGLHVLSKLEYLNKMKVYDDGKVYFIVCTKHVSRESAFKTLMEYTIEKMTKRRNNIDGLIAKFQEELVSC